MPTAIRLCLFSLLISACVESPASAPPVVDHGDGTYSVAAHEDFRASDRFPRWRAHIGPHFAAPPVVEHFTDVPA